MHSRHFSRKRRAALITLTVLVFTSSIGYVLHQKQGTAVFQWQSFPNVQKAIGPMSVAVGARTAVRGPTAADIGPIAFAHWVAGGGEGIVSIQAASDRPLLVLFTTWVYRSYKQEIHNNVLRTWRLWRPKVLPLLFSSEKLEQENAKSYGWQTLSPTTFACGGSVPTLRDMFLVAMAKYPQTQLFGFANGDLLLGSGLLVTMETVSRDAMTNSTQPVLLVLRRYNLNFTNRSGPVHTLREVDEMRAQAQEMTDGSSDAFFTNRLFPWQRVPDIVPGRLGVAMWLVAAARALNVTVIDVTDTVTAIHMTSQAGSRESHAHPNKMCNRDLFKSRGIEPSPTFACGFIYCAPWKTVHLRAVDAAHIKAKDYPGLCSNCYINTSLLKE